MGSRIGETPPAIRPRIHLGALLGAALGAVAALATRPEPVAVFVWASFAMWAGAFSARAGRDAMTSLLKWSALGMLIGLGEALLQGKPILASVGAGGLIIALVWLFFMSLAPLPGRPARNLAAIEKQLTRSKVDTYQLEVERSLIPYRERIQRGQADRLQQNEGGDPSEEL
jgi:hypothetical protein